MEKNIELFNVKSISKTIKKEDILKNISFNGYSSQIIGLVGPNGSGKSSLMKAMLGLIRFTGTIEIANKTIYFNDHPSLSKVGSLIEEPALYPFLTGREHLESFSLFKGKERQADINEIIEQLRLEEFIDKKANSYSLGMKQKLAIGISLLNKPLLVILDEPMNGLDIQALHELREIIINKKAQGTSFIISSHLLSELEKIVDQLVIIKNGELILDLPLDDFKKVEIFSVITDQTKELCKILSLNNIPHSKIDDNINIALSFSDKEALLYLLENASITLKKITKKDTKNLEDTFLQFIY